ncbi:MAG: LLM class flavin-dependent oxidoreductase [Solirubrobacterales bacterium]
MSLFNDQKLKLGVFCFNCSGGMTMSEASSLKIEWPEMVKIAKSADRIGFEAIVPVARWRGYGGATNHNGVNYEPFTWAAGLAAETERATIFSTCHLPIWHPIAAAKMATTIDHISAGRFGMNLVMGWFTEEMEMFGHQQREHDLRYEYGTEWVEIVKRVWSEEEGFDYRGRFFDLADVSSQPRPLQQPRPVLINAGSSPAGVDFATREVDFNLCSMTTLEAAAELVKQVQRKAWDEYRRKVGVITHVTILCRDTEREADEEFERLMELGDWEGADNWIEILGIESESFGEMIREFRSRFISGASHVVKGTPEQVAAELEQISATGIEGVFFGFLDYAREVEEFGEKVMPLLVEAGLRH